ncbi:MAG: undecaprenyldiphospho-muramoylpentapeptide beta-N-acetylglucosaminyltransferase [Gammaproteobacteria bacterium]
MNRRIVIMAGGTGGHVFPALAVAEFLLEKGWQVSWLGTRKGLEGRVVPENGIDIDWLSVSGIRGKGPMAKMTAAFGLIRACLQSLGILRRRRPDVVLGMGGFVSGPGGVTAKLLGIPLVIHEQNRVPGTTNRLLAKMADRVLEAFPDSFDKKIGAVCAGNPLRKDMLQQPRDRATALDRPFRILVFGGSQGARILNEVVPEAMALLPGVSVRHQTGAAMYELTAKRYRELSVEAEVSPFIHDMAAAYQWADAVICRSGAMTVSEVAAMGVPAIFVPLPNAIDDHQVANARYLTDAGAGMLLLQKDLDAETVAEKINTIKTQLPSMARLARQCAHLDATEVVAAHCMAEAGL